MSLRLSFTIRTITRPQWKALWRQLRIVNREAAMAEHDRLIFGTGFLQVGADVPDFIRRVHPSNVEIPMMGGLR